MRKKPVLIVPTVLITGAMLCSAHNRKNGIDDSKGVIHGGWVAVELTAEDRRGSRLQLLVEQSKYHVLFSSGSPTRDPSFNQDLLGPDSLSEEFAFLLRGGI